MSTSEGNNDSPLVLTEAGRQSYWLPSGENVGFIATGQDTGGQFSLFNFSLQPGTGPSPHIHHNEDEAFYILDGNVSFQMHDDESFTATSGSFLYLPKEHIHSFRDLGPTPARFLDIAVPSGIDKLFAALGSPATGTSPPPPPPLDPTFFANLSTISSQHGVDLTNSLIFTAPEYSVNNNSTSTVPISVARTGSTAGAVSANITLSGGTTTQSGNGDTKIPINFADGQSLQTVNVPINPANQAINLALTDLRGDLTPALLDDKAVLKIGGDSGNSLNLQELYNLPLMRPDAQRQSFSLEGGTATVIATSNDTKGHFSLLDVSLPGQTTGPEPYIQHQEDQGFYVLDGNVSFQLGNQTIDATPGTFVYTPKDDPYTFGNLGTTPARLLLLSSTPTAVPEPIFTWSLLPLVAWSVISQRKNKLKKQKLACRQH